MSTIYEQYQVKCLPADQLAELIPNGAVCSSEIALSAPRDIYQALIQRLKRDPSFRLTHSSSIELYPQPNLDESLREQVQGCTWFASARAKPMLDRGMLDYMSAYYHDCGAIARDYDPADTLLVAVSPMDKNGYFSCGCTASTLDVRIEAAKRIFVEVNKNMPRSLSSPMIHISRVTALCESDYPLPVLEKKPLGEDSIRIGQFIAAEIPDGATIQLGIGEIPDAVGSLLADKHDLGIHTEMLTDSMIGLIECGAVTNERKPIHKGKTVATFCFGSKRIYDYIDENPAVEVLPASYVNDPYVIAQHPNFISVNGALQVDLYGQICAESLGTTIVSGTGGHTDFVRGAVRSKGGKSFVAFTSTAKGGTVSRIVPTLTPGSLVTTGKCDTDYIVTEYGVAKVRGKTYGQRAKALIAIAHPKFRDQLLFDARKQNLFV